MVLMIIGLVAFIMIPSSSTLIDNQNRSGTLKKMSSIETALINFVIVNKRLPCPADGTAHTGLENGTNGVCAANQANGVVPWAAIGVSRADALDAWYNRITYRAGYGLTLPNALDMTSCDPAGTKDENGYSPPNISTHACDSSCTGTFVASNCTSPRRFLIGKGLDISDGTTKLANYLDSTGGAAFVLISHGGNGYGAIGDSGGYQATASRGVAGTTLENPNRNISTITNGVPPEFIDTSYADTNNAATYFDDIVIRPTILNIVNKAQLGPRSH